MRRIRCAIYTRKSSEEGLDQEFNSLDAQREACEAYVRSQRHEGWELIDARYDDGGISGGHLDRPALQRLLADVDARRVDQIVVYKIDRLTRSLADFARLVDRLDAANASFVSVTQSFNTGTSMGRLTLNVLLSFAQFEREVTAERIRDKIAASKRKGLWMGGYVPLGYKASGRSLEIVEAEAETVRTIYQLYEELGAINAVTRAAEQRGLRSKRYTSKSGRCRGGGVMSRGHIHHILTNPIYAGRISHKDQCFDGLHRAIIAPNRWDAVQEQLKGSAAIRRGSRQSGTPSLPLTGKLFDADGAPLSPTFTQKGTARYRYYVSRALRRGPGNDPERRCWRLPAAKLDDQVATGVQRHLESSIAMGLLSQAEAVDLRSAIKYVQDQSSDLLGLVARVVLRPGEVEITLDRECLASMFQVSGASINVDYIRFITGFTLHRRGVETRLVIDGSGAPVDQVLLRNIARGHAFLKALKSGRSIHEIAEENDLSKKRVQQILEFAFLSPDIVARVASGQQPTRLTTDWCMRNKIPAIWADQKRLLGAD